MSKGIRKSHLPLIIMGVVLIAAAAVVFWLASRTVELEERLAEVNAALTSRQQTLEASEANAADLQAELSRCEAALADAKADLTLAQEAHAGTQAALMAVTQEKADADALIADLTAANEALEQELQQLAADKEKADAALAALGYGRIETPAVTEEPAADEPESVEEEPAADEAGAVTGEPAEEEELIGEEPAVEPMMYNVYTADQLGLAFEAPVNWLVQDFEEGRYTLMDPENPDGCHSTLTIRSYAADGAALAEVLADLILTDDETLGGAVKAGEIVARELLGQPGLSIDQALHTQEGPVYCSRTHAAIIGDTVYVVSVSTTQARFEALVAEVYERFCASVRFVP